MVKWAEELRKQVESADYEREIYVLSAPRQGNTITRYILEHLTGYRSYGYIGSGPQDGIENRGSVAQNITSYDTSGIIFKRHEFSHVGRFTTQKEAPDSRLVVIVRNPLDWQRRSNVPKWLQQYADIIEGALSSDREHVKIFFYEALMTDRVRYVRELAEFLGSPAERLDTFLAGIESHMEGTKAPEQKTANQLEPNVCNVSDAKNLTDWKHLMSQLPDSVQEFFNHHYPECRWTYRK
ncbi:MAG: hypothetical protein CL599_16925 [Alteromonas sp.]|nr:hypothetical protein [Alteromonas sp.]